MNDPLVSIIMPVYNGEKYIKEAIDSVINQTYKNWELIIVNDGSKDNTERIVKSYDDKRIKYFYQENKGVSAARNRALEVAKGKYITFLDSDDYLPPNSIKAREEYLEKNPDIDIVDGKAYVMDENLEKIKRIYIPSYRGPLFPKIVLLSDEVYLTCFYMVRREIINSTKFKIGMTHGEDILFFIEISAAYNANYGYVNELVFCYRTGHGSAMNNLIGLENGYIRLYREILNLPVKINFYTRNYLKIKIFKIIFLIWLRQKQFKRAILSLKILFS